MFDSVLVFCVWLVFVVLFVWLFAVVGCTVLLLFVEWCLLWFVYVGFCILRFGCCLRCLVMLLLCCFICLGFLVFTRLVFLLLCWLVFSFLWWFMLFIVICRFVVCVYIVYGWVCLFGLLVGVVDLFVCLLCCFDLAFGVFVYCVRCVFWCCVVITSFGLLFCCGLGSCCLLISWLVFYLFGV